jgi:DnaJ-domain-containing protein 1
MLELAGTLLLVSLALLIVKARLARGTFIGSRREKPELEIKRRPSGQREFSKEQQPPRQQQHKQDRLGAGWRQQGQQIAKRSNEAGWWSDLGVSPDASIDEIRQSYLRKIKEYHPDRVAWLAPELLEASERRAKTLNAAYTEAIRQRRGNG